MKKVDDSVIREVVDTILLLLSPMVPHFAAEMWQRCGHANNIEEMSWPEYDDEAAKDDLLTIVVQVNGKVRSRLETAADTADELIKDMALQDEKILRFIEDKPVKKVIVVKNKLVNIVV